jgi:primosomal protein N' (replication factor Y)
MLIICCIIQIFRAFERSFQWLRLQGVLVDQKARESVQTYNLSHNTIQQVATDYAGMYKEQLYDRQIYKYPPYFRIIKLTLKHESMIN